MLRNLQSVYLQKNYIQIGSLTTLSFCYLETDTSPILLGGESLVFTFLSRYHIFMVQHTGADKVGKFYYFGVAIAPDSTRVEDIPNNCLLGS